MPAVTAAMITGGSAIFGDLLGAWGQSETNAQNYQMFKENMDWQTQMSNTAEQRRFADYKAAGVNPLLVTSSQGASSPSISTPVNQNPMASFQQLGAQAQQAAMMKAQIENVQANTEKTIGETKPHGPSVTVTDQKGTETTGYAKGSPYGAAELRKALGDADSSEEQANLLRAQIKNVESTTDINTVALTLDKLDLKQKQELYDTVVKRAKAEASSASSAATVASTEARMYDGQWGGVLRLLEKLTGIVKVFK